MPFAYTIAPTVTTTPLSDASVRLLHGTGIDQAISILEHTLDRQRAIAYGGTGDFWTTTDPDRARWYAVASEGDNRKVILGIDLRGTTLEYCLSQPPGRLLSVVEKVDYEWRPKSFSTLIGAITNVTLTYIEK